MARLLGPDMGSRYAYLASGAPAASLTAVVYANSAGTILADIHTYDGSETPAGAILSSTITTDANGLLPLFWFPDSVDRAWISVNGGPITAIDADYNRRLDATRGRVFNASTYGATGDGVTDDAPAVQAAIDAAAAAGGGEVRLGKGIYLCAATIVWPLDVPVALRGEGRDNTSLRRAVGLAAPLAQGLGTVSDRVKFDISDVELHGNGGSATVVRFDKVSNSRLSDVRVGFATGTLLHASEWWNSWVERALFHNGGTGAGTPASLFDGDCNTLHFTDCEWEANSGTDLRMSGLAFLFANPKMERGTGNYPLVDIVEAGACQFTGGFFHLGDSATTAGHVHQKGTAVIPARPNGFTNCEFSGNVNAGGVPGGDALVPYFIDMTVGELLLSNCSMNGNPTTAFVHAGSGVGLNALRMRNVAVTDPSKLLHDERAGSLYGYGSIPLVPIAGTGYGANVVVESANDRVIWRFPDAQTAPGNRIIFANVPIPADAADGRPVRIRYLWYASVNTGNIRHTVGVKVLTLSNDDVTAGLTAYTTVTTVPATASRTTSTTIVTTNNVVPGARYVSVLLQRDGTDGTDTCTGEMRLLGAELLYERAV